MFIKRHTETRKRRRYNDSTCKDIAVVFVAENGGPPVERDLCVFF